MTETTLPGPAPGLPTIWTLEAYRARSGICAELQGSVGVSGVTCGLPGLIERYSVGASADFYPEGSFVWGFAARSAAEIRVEFPSGRVITATPIVVSGFPVTFFLVSIPREVPTVVAVDARGRILARRKPSVGGVPAAIPKERRKRPEEPSPPGTQRD